MRPQLSEEEADRFRRDNVLRYVGTAGAERDDPWSPTPLDAAGLTPDYVVGPGGGCASVQETVNRALREQRKGRVIIGVAAGLHRGLVYVPRASFAVTLLGLGASPSDVVLAENIDAEMQGSEYTRRFAAHFADAHESIAELYRRIAGLSPISTANASVLRVENDGFQLLNLTVQNTYNCDRSQGGDLAVNALGQFRNGQHQAVALLVAGADRVQVQNVVLRSFQDTLYLQSPRKGETVRSCFTDCEIAGDVDFIFGQSTAWFEGCTIRSLGGRAATTWATAPSTDIRTSYGFVFEDCDFIHDGCAKGRHFLGRQWFEGVRATPFGTPDIAGYHVVMGHQSAYDPPRGTISTATLNSVGKCVIMRSRIGDHINGAVPWDDWGGNRWNPRYRPALYCARAMIEYLQDWLDAQGQGYADLDTDAPFLAEYVNSGNAS